jgi:preprotein translocase subunit YajC
MGAIVSLALMLILFWVLLVLPQRRRMQAQRALIASVDVGDEIVTTAGLHGVVVEIEDDVLHLEVADGVVLRSARWAVGQKVVEPEPESEIDADFDDELDDEDRSLEGDFGLSEGEGEGLGEGLAVDGGEASGVTDLTDAAEAADADER